MGKVTIEEPYSWDDSGFLVTCNNCKGDSVGPGGLSYYYKKCEDCNGTGMVDEFYWQGIGGAPPYWKGNIIDRDGTKEVSMKPKLDWPDDVINGLKEHSFE